VSEYDEFDYANMQAEYEAELIDKAIAELSTDSIRWYLATNGDSIEKRVDTVLKEAENLFDNGHFGPSLIAAVTSIEIIFRFFVLRPIVHGAFLSDEWAQILLDRIVSGRSYIDRKLLPKVVKYWSIDIEKIKLSAGCGLWSELIKKVWPNRNDVVHKASEASQEMAKIAIECVHVIMKEIVIPLALSVGIDKSKTGVWHIVKNESSGEYSEKYYRMADPFR